MADVLPTELFTWTSLGTFTGLTGATVVVTNTAARAFDWNPRWLGLLIALVLCIALAVANKSPAVDYLLALLNGCLVSRIRSSHHLAAPPSELRIRSGH